MEYYVLLGLHVGAVGIWIGGMLLSSLAIYIETVTAKDNNVAPGRLALALKWNRFITTPAMIAVWGLGIAMTMQVGWYLFTWLKVKVILVLLLSALQGIQSAKLRRISRGAAPALSPLMRFSAPLTVLLTIIIIVLVMAKPFGA